MFRELLERGDLPNISKYVVEKGTFTNAVSVFPSTTGPAYAPFILGKFPGRCNLPGIRWFDRKLYANKLFSPYRFRSYVGPEGFFMSRDVSKHTPTLFEIFPEAVSIFNEITRGIVRGGNKTKFSTYYYKVKGHFTNRSDEVDLVARRLLLSSLRDPAEFIYAVFLGIDAYSHQKHPFHDEVIKSYLRIDESIGLAAKDLGNRGRLDETLFIVTSDHGLTQTHSHFDSVEFMDSLGFKTFYYPSVFKRWKSADAANMISGNAMTHIYVKSSDGWERKNTFGELSGLVDRFLQRPEVDIVAGPDESGKVRIKSERGEALTWLDKDGGIRYERISGDPFGYDGLPQKMDADEVLKFSFETDYPDALLQLIQLFESPRSGDLAVSAKRGFDLRFRHENPEHCSSHGALFREHMIVPLAISVKISRKFVRTADLYSTILRLLGKPVPEGADGVSLV